MRNKYYVDVDLEGWEYDDYRVMTTLVAEGNSLQELLENASIGLENLRGEERGFLYLHELKPKLQEQLEKLVLEVYEELKNA